MFLYRFIPSSKKGGISVRDFFLVLSACESRPKVRLVSNTYMGNFPGILVDLQGKTLVNCALHDLIITVLAAGPV